MCKATKFQKGRLFDRQFLSFTKFNFRWRDRRHSWCQLLGLLLWLKLKLRMRTHSVAMWHTDIMWHTMSHITSHKHTTWQSMWHTDMDIFTWFIRQLPMLSITSEVRGLKNEKILRKDSGPNKTWMSSLTSHISERQWVSAWGFRCGEPKKPKNWLPVIFQGSAPYIARARSIHFRTPSWNTEGHSDLY